MHRRHLWHWLLGALAIPVVLPMLLFVGVFLVRSTYELLGYHAFVFNGEKIAQIAYAKGDPKECGKIRVVFAINTNTYQEAQYCTFTLAKLTKDPTICELLMPSGYGLSCVGGAESHELPCATEAYSVYWNDGNNSKIATLKECNKSDPKRTLLGNQCCHIAKVRYLLNENDCSPFSGNTDLNDRCLYDLAWKTRNPVHCNNILNENAHKACEVQTRALQKDPSICIGCTPPVESIEDLKEENPER